MLLIVGSLLLVHPRMVGGNSCHFFARFALGLLVHILLGLFAFKKRAFEENHHGERSA
jgi:hypothetical protein